MSDHTHPRSRVRLGLVALLAVVALLAAACGSPPTSGNSSGGRESAGSSGPKLTCPLSALKKASGPVKINVWYAGLAGVTLNVMKDMVSRFNKSQDKIVVTANNQGQSYEENLRKYEGASSKPSQLPQVIYLEDNALGEMVDKGQVLPAEGCMKADDYDITQITPVARSGFSVDGVLYPGYMNVSSPVLYFNKSDFQKAGLDPENPPRTLDEIEAAAKKLKDTGVAGKPLSFNLKPWFFENWMSGLGEDIVNNDNGRTKPATKATFANENGTKLVTWLQDMNKKGLMVPFADTEGTIDHYLALLNKDRKKRASMLIETSTATTTVTAVVGGQLTAEDLGVKVDASIADKNDFIPGVAKLPGLEAPGKVFAGGGAFYILNTSKPAQQAASWEFLKFMLQPENAKEWHVKGSYLPIVKSVLDEPAVADFWAKDPSGVLLKNAVDQLMAADPDQPGPLIGPYPGYRATMRSALAKIVLDGADPKATLKDAQDDVTKQLEDYNGG